MNWFPSNIQRKLANFFTCHWKHTDLKDTQIVLSLASGSLWFLNPFDMALIVFDDFPAFWCISLYSSEKHNK